MLTPDGSVWWFGYGQDRDGRVTSSVGYVPVFGNDAGEPCHDTWADSAHEDDRVPCRQAYRWMLDRVVDADEVQAAYFYTQETNGYRSIEGPNVARSYVSNLELSEIDYGWAFQQDVTDADYADKVTLSYKNRCVSGNLETNPLDNGAPTCPTIASDPSDYPDVPVDVICDGTVYGNGCVGSDGVTSYSPVFFSRDELWQINTYVVDAGTHAAHHVAEWQTRHTVSNDDDVAGTSGSPDFLWLDYLQRQTFYGGTTITLPVINFSGEGDGSLDNVVGGTSLVLRRVSRVYTDLGGLITVHYGHGSSAATCDATHLPSDEADNHMECFKQKWLPEGASTQKTNWFKKFVVTQVDVNIQWVRGGRACDRAV